MRFVTVAASAAALFASILLGALPAGAENVATPSDCMKAAEQVKDALSTNGQSGNYAQAEKEKGYGRDFCNNGLYAYGVAHYDAALRLLGASKS